MKFPKFIEKIKKFFSKKNKRKKELLLNTKKEKDFASKRKHLSINLEFFKHLNFLKRKYIPFFLIFCVVFIVVVIILVIGPFFRVETIEITRKDNITNMNIAYKSVEAIRWQQMFKIEELDVFHRLKNYQDNIRSIDTKFVLPKTLKIEIESYKEIFNVVINDVNYILLENWTVIPTNHSKNLRFLNIINNIDKNKFIEYKQIFNPIFLDKINLLIKKFEQNFLNVEIVSLNYYEVERELHIGLENGKLIIFSLDDDISINDQIEKLAIFNKDYFWIENNIYVYIDLRIRNKVFYCHNDEATQCQRNLDSLYK